ncbi:AI-2E family transporter [Hymenobacter aquaticus]|uniref:AI-2E family transporter n=1 Tax=Hymenobacter aquaticus TaxID=1867101 RepID=A0A4Z0Q320_9BACT|nr:AI-2E family transporter [Hymenobacter aquaticus]TGE23876.1 AI-2E family transporter [Hymenobacter aquaticus]
MSTAQPPQPFPAYVKAVILLLGLVLLVLVLQWAWVMLAPLFLATLLAILLLPVHQRLRRWHLPQVLAISLTVLLTTAVLAGLLYFLYTELVQLTRELPGLQAKLTLLISQLQAWIDHTLGLSNEQQLSWLSQLGREAGSWAARAVASVSGWALGFGLIPIYVFLLLYYRPLLVTFLVRVFGRGHSAAHVTGILTDTKALMLRYVQGLLMEALLVAGLDAAGLFIIGLEHALLLGVLLNFIPYVGSIIATIVPMLLALATTDSLLYPAAVLGLFIVVQLIDNEILVPRVVASQVKINALAAVLAVLLGNAIGGVIGMFLALPTLAVLKTIFDRIEPLKPYGMLLGDQPKELR